jgi:hypothetical protein
MADTNEKRFTIRGSWDLMVPLRVKVPEPIANLLMDISELKGDTYYTPSVREMIVKGIEEKTGINIVREQIQKTKDEPPISPQ